MPVSVQNLLIDRYADYVNENDGVRIFDRGYRKNIWMDVQYIRLCYKMRVSSATGSLGIAVHWAPRTEEDQPAGTYDVLINGPLVAAGDGLVSIYSDWTDIGDECRASQGILLRTLLYGDASRFCDIDYCFLLYR